MEKDLIRKIRGLKDIQPSDEWMNSTREQLVTQINSGKGADFMGIGFFQWIKQPQQFALAFCLTLIVLAGPWLALEASKASLPGELLYSVKKISEDVQIKVASEDNKTQLKVEFASRRLDELNKIAEDWQKSEQIGQVASELKNSLTEASVYAGKIAEGEVIAVVKKANKIKEELDEAKEDASSEVQAELTQAGEAVEEINEQIFTVLNRKYQEQGENTGTTTDQEILIFIRDLEDGTITTTDKVINGAE